MSLSEVEPDCGGCPSSGPPPAAARPATKAATTRAATATLADLEGIVAIRLRQRARRIGAEPRPAVGIGDGLGRGEGRRVRLDAAPGILARPVDRGRPAVGQLIAPDPGPLRHPGKHALPADESAPD